MERHDFRRLGFMRTLSVAALMALFVTGGLLYAQGSPQRSEAEKRRIMAEFARQHAIEVQAQRDRELKTTCELPDGTVHPLNTLTSYEGQAYRCVEALRSDGVVLKTYAAGWVKVPLTN
jgi:hypothetical protein